MLSWVPAVFAGLTVLAFQPQALAEGTGEAILWRDYVGVTWETGPDAKADPESPKLPIAGVHIANDHRVFVSVPRPISALGVATLNVLDSNVASGPARLKAFPTVQANSATAPAGRALRSVLGFYVDETNHWLWALDMGYVAGEAEAPVGGQKIVVYDLVSQDIVKYIPLDAVADRKGSFLNDIVVDERSRFAYVSDSGLRGGASGLIIVDGNSGHARRVLDNDASVRPEAGAAVISHGTPVLPGQPLKPGINGIALSKDGGTLYWTVTTGTHAHAASTANLRNAKLTLSKLAMSVRDLGDVGGNTDGIVLGGDDNLYITDLTRNGVVRYDMRTGTTALVVSDERIRWPDTIANTPDGDIVFSSSALNERFMGIVKPGEDHNQLWRLLSDGARQ